jgi:hypothetical protein
MAPRPQQTAKRAASSNIASSAPGPVEELGTPSNQRRAQGGFIEIQVVTSQNRAVAQTTGLVLSSLVRFRLSDASISIATESLAGNVSSRASSSNSSMCVFAARDASCTFLSAGMLDLLRLIGIFPMIHFLNSDRKVKKKNITICEAAPLCRGMPARGLEECPLHS